MQGFNFTHIAKMPKPPKLMFIAQPVDSNTTVMPDVQVAQQYLAAVQRGDMSAVLALLADDVVLHIPGRSPISGEYQGPQAVLEYLNNVRRLSNNTYAFQDLIWLIMEPHIHNVTVEQAVRNGTSYDFNRSTVYQMRDGKIADIEVHEEDQYAIDAFWS